MVNKSSNQYSYTSSHVWAQIPHYLLGPICGIFNFFYVRGKVMTGFEFKITFLRL